MTLFALVDCNNFYASCERVFNPRLEGKPVVVLSNNDGCAIARSEEAKALGIKMGEPYFKIKALCQKQDVQIFSSNFQLYGDMSQRVMSSLGVFCPDLEVYSIDEAFLNLEGLKHLDLTQYAQEIRQKVKMWTGIPVSIGIASTKTLAKVANHIAKKQKREGVFYLESRNIEGVLQNLPIAEIWGIGRRWGKKLNALGIWTALDLKKADPKRLRKIFSVVVERVILELRGISCLEIEDTSPKKSIMVSRSFRDSIQTQEDLEEAVSNFAVKAAEKLRGQGSKAHGLYVFFRTSPYEERYYKGEKFIPFITPVSDTGIILKAAKKGVEEAFQKGFKYKKAGVLLLDLWEDTQEDLFLRNKTSEEDKTKLMGVIDSLNQKMGSNTIFYGAQGIKRTWSMRQDLRSPRYTTKWDELLVVN